MNERRSTREHPTNPNKASPLKNRHHTPQNSSLCKLVCVCPPKPFYSLAHEKFNTTRASPRYYHLLTTLVITIKNNSFIIVKNPEPERQVLNSTFHRYKRSSLLSSSASLIALTNPRFDYLDIVLINLI
jgi:hypothetical protein